MHQNYWFLSLHSALKIIGIGYAEFSWGDLKTIMSGKISALGSIISEKKSIVYKYACIESERIVCIYVCF